MTLRDHIACHGCDLLHTRIPLDDGHTAHCQRCGATLVSEKVGMVHRALALNLSALVFYIIALSLPFLGIEANGVTVQIKLVNAVGALYEQKMSLIAVVILIVLLVAPAVRILGMLYVLLPMEFGVLAPKARRFFRVIDLFRPWNMVEVFLIGILVTFVKLGDMATIFLGVSFWAFVAMVVVIILADLSVDRYRFWDHLDLADRRRWS